MPLYEYACDACGARFERIRKFSDAPVSTCPTCGGPVQKLISSPAFHLKGSGWYITDYARSGQKSGDSSSAESQAGSSKDAAAKDNSADKATSSTSESSKESSKPAAEPAAATTPKASTESKS